MKNYIFTSESVTEGHPDKVCDQISDAVLDAIIVEDKNSRVAVETAVSTGLVLVMGEVTTNAYVDIQKIARQTILDIGYNKAEYGFDGESCSVLTAIKEQSPDIAMGTNNTMGGAGDQGMMFGYACNQTPELMPLPISLAHKLAHRLADVRKNGTLSYLRPDGKTQVSIEYNGKTPIRIDTIVVSTQHSPDVTQAEIKNDIIKEVITPIIPENLMQNTKILTNPTGSFTLGGPSADCGLTGRKIIVDTYGGYASHGGGAFSGKDPTKVDRSGAYMARFIAKNIVAQKMADECEIQLAYAIGVPEPVSVLIKTNDTEKIPLPEIQKYVKDNFDLTPKGIIEKLDLLNPIYQKTATYGHFGREEFTWEEIKC